MPAQEAHRLFASSVTAEFGRYRVELAHRLDKVSISAVYQEEFEYSDTDLVEKLYRLIQPCDVVVHFVGAGAGTKANPKAVEEFLAICERERRGFLEFWAKPEYGLDRGFFDALTYTQWEAVLAVFLGKQFLPLAPSGPVSDGHPQGKAPFVATTADKEAQERHRAWLTQIVRRYPQEIAPDADGSYLADGYDKILGFLLREGRGWKEKAETLRGLLTTEQKIASTQLDDHAPRVLFGRETELAALDEAWEARKLNIYTLVAWGGAGKTSLAFHWVQTRFAAKEPSWPGVERYFDWSFYSQGTGESRQTSADLFIAKALAFFGDPDPTVGGPHERGERLAGLIRRYRTLLILDGIEPLQYPPGDPQAGRLKDPALEALLRELAVDNPGLVVITTREHLKNLGKHATIEEQKLDKLPRDAAVALLRHKGIVGTDKELHEAWQDAGGHALTLSLLGRYVADAYEDRDIRHYREVNFEEADRERQGRSAFKVMVAYERWLQNGGPARQRELALLRLTGLFDRPMAKGCLEALRAEPAIPGLTDALVKLSPQQWNVAVKRLSEVELLLVSADAIDAHPLIREYFALQLQQEQPAAFRAAHSRLFDFLCETTPYRPDDLDGLAPLYAAVTHGCLAGRHQEAREKVYIDRILRGTGIDGFYSWKRLGAIGADLAAVAAFFTRSPYGPWSQVSQDLSAGDQAWLLSDAALRLRSLGRLTEALQPMRVGLEMGVRQKDWKNAAMYASNLSELELTLGRLPEAVSDALQSISHADQSGDAFERMVSRTTAADALHQCGQRTEAGPLFAEAEGRQQEWQPQFDLLYSLGGFRYCDWLLVPAERAAWQQILHEFFSKSKPRSQISEILDEVERRGNKMFEWRVPADSLLNIALDHLTLARVGLIRAILVKPLPQPTLDLPHFAAAVYGLRATGMMNQLPRGLLTASLFHFVRGEHDLAEKELTEAQQIAERGPMPLFLADVHLNRARFGLATADRWQSHEPTSELKAARELIEKHGYGRRMEELIDAERSRDVACGDEA